MKRYLFLGRKAMPNLDIILKSRDITLPTDVCIINRTGVSVSTSDDGSQIIDARSRLKKKKNTMWNYDNERQTWSGS